MAGSKAVKAEQPERTLMLVIPQKELKRKLLKVILKVLLTNFLVRVIRYC